MRGITPAIIATLLLFATASAQAQSSSPTPPPEVKKWGIWIGDWELSGTAKDTPTGHEYKVNWALHERWILGGFFVQVDQTWKGDGPELHSLEILSYDPIKKIHTSSGYSSDGSTWTLTATFDGATVKEQSVSNGPDGQATTCNTTWVFSGDRKSLSGTQECELNGVRWTAIRVSGTKSTRKN
jgi:hypothetical protein